MSTWLLFDVNSLAHRAFHTTGGLSYNNVPTGSTFGVLGAIIQYQGEFHTNHCAFAFDFGKNLRYKLSPTYKAKRRANRKKQTEREKKLYHGLEQQINLLRKEYLREIGFQNIFYQKGYEADDIIASVCQNAGNNQIIVISSDEDMFQLLSKRVRVFSPSTKTLWTKKKFKIYYGIKPKQWAIVKAIAGCGSDEVSGIPGVGEKTAIQFLNFTLTKNKKFDSIVSKEGLKIRDRNLPLVKLPMEGCKDFHLKVDKNENWTPLLKRLGMKSLRAKRELVFREK